MFEATLSEKFWGDEDFTCNKCHITFTSRRGASEHAERAHDVRKLLIKDRSQVKVETERAGPCEVIQDIDVNMNCDGEYFEFMEDEEIKEEVIKLEEPFLVKTNEGVGSQTGMDVGVNEDEGVKMEVKDIKVDGPSSKRDSGEDIEEDEAVFRFEPSTKKHKIPEEGEPIDPDEDDSDSDSDTMTAEKYDRQAKMDAVYQEQLGINIEDDGVEEEKQVLSLRLLFSPLQEECIF